jgi:TonB family protein
MLLMLASCETTPPTRQPIQPGCLATGLKQCLHGWVLVEVDIAPSGRVSHAEIVEACPDDSFNWKALESVRKWRWRESPEGKADHQTILCRP